MFEGIGKINSYLQQNNLQIKMNYKMKTGQDLDNSKKDDNNNIVDIMLSASSTSKDSGERVESLRQKLMNGRELSDEELRYLEKNNPDLYEKAVKTQRVREDLRQELKHAKSKAEAQQAVTRARIAIAASAKAELSGAGGLGTAAGTSSAGSGTGAAAMTAAPANIAGASAAASNINAAVAPAVTAAAPAAAADTTATANGAAAAYTAASTDTSSLAATDTSTSSSASSISEKYIMQFQAVDDEWKKFSHSKQYMKLPEEEKKNKFSLKAATKKI